MLAARRLTVLSVAILATALGGLAACGGGGGGGSQGPPGPPGPPSPNPIVIGPYDPLPGVNVVLTSVTGGSGPAGALRVGDVLTVHFTAKSDSGIDLDVPSMSPAQIYLSGPSNNYQRVIPPQTDVASRAVFEGAGVWAYTFTVPIPATYAAPANDTGSPRTSSRASCKGTGLLDGTYTVGLQLSTSYDINGSSKRDSGAGTIDLSFGAAVGVQHREVVANQNCNACHTSLRAHGGTRVDVRLCVLCHTAGAQDSNIGGATPGVSVAFKVMIHRIHNGEHLPSVLGVATTDPAGTRDYTVAPKPLQYANFVGDLEDFSDVGFPVFPSFNIAMPKDEGYSALSTTDPDGTGPLLSPRARDDAVRLGVVACAKCHGDPDGAGPDVAPAQGALSRTQPSRESCGSCHDDVDWTKAYHANGQTMPSNRVNGSCALCHAASGDPLAVDDAHRHPLNDAAIDAGVNTVVLGVSGGTGSGGNFQNGDNPTLTFAVRDDGGGDVGLATMDACSAFFLGPTTNRQLVMPLPTPNGISLTPYDFSGRLQAVSTTGKGSMSKVFLGPTAVAETLVVQFTSSTSFTVTGTTTGALGVGLLPRRHEHVPLGRLRRRVRRRRRRLGVRVRDVRHRDDVHGVGGRRGFGRSGGVHQRLDPLLLARPLVHRHGRRDAVRRGERVPARRLPGTAANPVRFAVTAGSTAFSAAATAPDRFYYDVVPDAPTYTLPIPEDIVFEDVGTGSGVAGQTLSAVGNLPVYYGRQQLWESALTATTATSTGAVAALSRQMEVASTTGFSNGNLVVVDSASGLGVREFVQVAPARADGVIAAAGDATVRLYFKTPLRYAHPGGVTVAKVGQVLRQEGAGNAYTLNSTTGVVTANPAFAFTAGVPLVMSYRTKARFGYRRHGGDALQTTYVPPANDSADIGQEQAEWKGLPYMDGTYTADLWFARNIELGRGGEVQTYRSTSNAGTVDFLYGSAVTIVPHAIISDSANCYRCHDDVIFHGGGRRGLDACLTCHSTSGNEDKPRWDTPLVSGTTTPTALTPGVAIEFRQMLHKIHRGSSLAEADTYTVVGNGGSPSTFGDIVFPATPGGVMQCVKCHGNDAWHAPAPRDHPAASVPARVWGVVCGSCHDSTAAHAHIDVQTASDGAESCAVCHGAGREEDVVKVHVPR